MELIKVKIFPDMRQKAKIDDTFLACQFVYNEVLKAREEARMNFNQSRALLPKLKEENPFLKDVDSIALQFAVKRLDFAYQQFFLKVAPYPKMIKIIHEYMTCNTKNSIRIEDGKIRLPKLGFIRIEPDISIEYITSVMLKKVGTKDYFLTINQCNN